MDKIVSNAENVSNSLPKGRLFVKKRSGGTACTFLEMSLTQKGNLYVKEGQLFLSSKDTYLSSRDTYLSRTKKNCQKQSYFFIGKGPTRSEIVFFLLITEICFSRISKNSFLPRELQIDHRFQFNLRSTISQVCFYRDETSPTDRFTILELPSPSHDFLILHKILRSPDPD